MLLLPLGFRLDRVLRTPFKEHPATAGVQRLCRGRLEVLTDDDELAAVVEIDDVPGEHARVDDVADPAGGGVLVVTTRAAVVGHADLLRPDRERAAGALENVRGSDEAGDEGVLRTFVDRRRRADLLDLAFVEDREAIAHRQRLLLVVRDINEGDPDLADGALDPFQLDLHLLAELEVEGPERFVEQQHFRAVHERPRERDALSLAAGELDRLAVGESGELDHLEDLFDAQPSLAARDTSHTQAVLDVLANCHVRKQRVVLEHRVDVSGVRRLGGDVAPRELDSALGGPLEAGDQAQRSRLARARGPEQGEELPGPDFEVDAIDGDYVAVGLTDADEPHIRCVYACSHAGPRRSLFLDSHYSAPIISMLGGATQRCAACG